jgi:hypothetical protein
LRTATGSIDIPALIGALIKAGLLYIAVGITLLVIGLQLIGVNVGLSGVVQEKATTAAA